MTVEDSFDSETKSDSWIWGLTGSSGVELATKLLRKPDDLAGLFCVTKAENKTPHFRLVDP